MGSQPLVLSNCVLFSSEFDGVFVIGLRFGVEFAPAIVFLKDPGMKPIVYHGMSFLFLCLTPFVCIFYVILCSLWCLNNKNMHYLHQALSTVPRLYSSLNRISNKVL